MEDLFFIFKITLVRLFLWLPFTILNSIDDRKLRKSGGVPLEDRFGIIAFTGLARLW